MKTHQIRCFNLTINNHYLMNLLPKIAIYAMALMIAGVTTAYAQVVPPSANASSLAKFANTPVNFYTGTPTIQVPLVSLPSKTMSVSVGLSYHASGIKVQDMASSVGLGWTLNAGGVITRVVQGLPDDDLAGYSGGRKTGNQMRSRITDYPLYFFDRVGSGQQDAEPDMFFFNFMGRTGRFVLDAGREAHLIPHQDLKIEVEYTSNRFEQWKITAEDGTVYRFGTEASARETSDVRINRINRSDQRMNYISSWYLTDVNAPNVEDNITFTYESGNYVTTKYYNYVETREARDCYGYDNPEEHDLHTTVRLAPSRRIKQIQTVLGEMKFLYQYAREDINDQALSEITLLDSKGQTKRRIALRYGNFQDCTFGGMGESCSRLRLEEIEDITESFPLPLQKFNYREDFKLPPRNSSSYDHWGYANNHTLFSHWADKMPYTSFNGRIYQGISRDPGDNVYAYLLKRITNVTGGVTEYDYEPNKAELNRSLRRVGGVRVKKITQYQELGGEPTLVKSYDYQESGQVFSTPVYGKSVLLADRRTNGCYIDNTVIIRYAQSLNSLFDLSGIAMGYSEVIEALSDGSTTKYTFTNFETNPDNLTNVYRITPGRTSNISSGGGRSQDNSHVSPYPPTTSLSWQRGQILELEQMNSDGKPVRKVKYYYDTDQPIRSTILGAKIETINPSFQYFVYHVGQYEINSQPYFPEYSVEEVYDQTDHTSFVSTRTDYTYNPTYMQLKSTRVTDSDGTLWYTFFRHPTDYLQIFSSRFNSNGSVSWQQDDSEEALSILGMLASHQHSQVIESNILRKRAFESQPHFVSGTLSLFELTTENSIESIRPTKIYNLSLNEPLSDFTPFTINREGSQRHIFTYDSRYEQISTLDAYDEDNNLVQQTGRDNIATSQLYGYDQSLPIAQVVGAAKDQIAYTSFEAPDAGGTEGNMYVNGNIQTATDAPAGNQVYRGNTTLSVLSTVDQLPAGDYVVSVWAKSSNAEARIDVTGTSGEKASMSVDGNGQWQQYQTTISLGGPIRLGIALIKSVIVDEVRVYPVGAQMTTYTYDPLVGITSKTDANNITTYYGYDGLNRLRLIKDQHRDIRQRYQYVYKSTE